MKTIKEIKRKYIKILNENNIDDSTSVVGLIMQKVLNCNKNYLLINDNENIDEYKEKEIDNYVREIINGKPIEYITNRKEFMNSYIYVNEDVLIPRQDTEVLVETVISLLQKEEYTGNINILDLCTGSGCISVGLLNYLKYLGEEEIYNKINIVASDISSKALYVTKINVDKYSLNEKIKIVESNIFENLKEYRFDIIISNPPYIKSDDINRLDSNVKNEPILALDGGLDGLYFYENISKEAISFLNKNGYIIYEIGYDQAKEVEEILKKYNYSNIEVIKDLFLNDRVVVGKKM